MWNLLIPALGTVIDKIFPDANAAAQAKLKLFEMQQTGELAKMEADVKLALGQIEVNKIEAGNTSLFVSGWRPAVGWVCVLGLVYNFLGFPILTWVSTAYAIPAPPNLPLGDLIVLLGGMLGLGGLRTVEKLNNVARG